MYLHQVKQHFPNALKLQSIPEDEYLWKVENYEKFLESRREMLATELNNFLSNISITQHNVSAHVDLTEIIKSGERGFLEFKSTMPWNWKENRLDKKMEEIILKTVAAFSNAEGGKLLIGVTDEGSILGLESDYSTFKEVNKDRFELQLQNIVNNAFGKDFGAMQLSVKFPSVDDLEICEIDINAGNRPIYFDATDKNGQSIKKFYVRSGNTSQQLDIAETASYIKNRF